MQPIQVNPQELGLSERDHVIVSVGTLVMMADQMGVALQRVFSPETLAFAADNMKRFQKISDKLAEYIGKASTDSPNKMGFV